ncbi:MAG: toll/interleukin-1 receptor domain-containing protein, partial [Clostridia bacterium]|nr:toll/interleukin-1 receptor domain-containing protein [Clostridia bacterium]
MLLILYGAIAEMGLKSREYLNKIGFHTVEKLNYAVAPQMTTKYGTRNFVSEEEFMENTDSLFRYEVGGIRVGFNQRQISDAVCDKTDSLLTLSAKDISFLSEIKRVYADKVCLVYAYIDDATLRGIVYGLKDITDDEARVRLETGRDVKRGYLKFRSIFDHVVMYGGEDSEFDYESLYRQFDAIVGARTLDKTDGIRYADVLISSARRDREIYAQIRTALMKRGISVFDDGDIPAGEEPVSVISEAIQKAKIVIPVVTANSLSGKWVMAETRFTLESAEKNGTFILPVFEEGIDLDAAPVIKERLERLSCVFIENGEVENAAERLADRIYKLLSAEAELKAYAKRVDNYLFLKMHDQAKCWQEAHLGLCDEVFATSGGAFIDFEACLLSRIKLISILMDMRSYGEAL